MKIIFVKKSPPFYENLTIRKSYLSVVDGVVKQDEKTMLANQDEFFAPYFPSKQEQDSIADNFNYDVLNVTDRELTIRSDNFNEIYPNEYQFWNNVNYAKIIHNNGFIEYCYIKDRSCDNLAVNQWNFTLYVDVWNTYWIKVYQAIIANKDIYLDIVRWHENRFSKVNIDGVNKYIFKFLYTQNTAFWNKEAFEQSIKSIIPVETDKTLTPWKEFNKTGTNIIPKAEYLKIGYDNKIYGEEIQRPFFGYQNGFLSAMISTDGNAKSKPWKSLNTFNGMLNSYWIIPIINNNLTDENGRIDDRFKILIEMFDNPNNTKNRFAWWANDLNNIISNVQTASIIQTPKPILPFGSRIELNTKWNDWTYPIRTRDRYAENNNKTYSSSQVDYNWEQVSIKLGEEDLQGVILTPSLDSFFNSENLANYKTSILNALADERIPADKIVEKLVLPTKQKLIQEAKTELEPKIYDEEITNIVYTHYNQVSITISPKWYFYQNWDDLNKYKSIFLMGYQFTQPHIVGLIQAPISGLYNNKNLSASTTLVSFFAPNQQTATDQQKQFLVNNRSQMNTALNNQKQNSIIGGTQNVSSSIISGAVGGAIAGSVVPGLGTIIGGIAGVAGGIANGIFGGIKASNQYTQLKASQEAKLSDLANTPNASTDPLTESSFKLLNSYDGFYILNMPSLIDQDKIWSFHVQNGYTLNKLVPINPSKENDLKILSFMTRIYYNYYQINQLKTALQEVDILNEYKEYFESLFEKGIMLFHHSVTSKENKLLIKVNDFSKENWEIDLWDELEKE